MQALKPRVQSCIAATSGAAGDVQLQPEENVQVGGLLQCLSIKRQASVRNLRLKFKQNWVRCKQMKICGSYRRTLRLTLPPSLSVVPKGLQLL